MWKIKEKKIPTDWMGVIITDDIKINLFGQFGSEILIKVILTQ